MRIAQVSPLFERVPPTAYGGTERVVSYLTEELVRRGHDVTLFASGDSQTRARLVPGCAEALRPAGRARHHLGYHLAMIDEVFARAADFDVIHFHTDLFQFPFARACATPCVTTLHGRLDLDDFEPCFRRFRDQAFVSISDAQRAPMPWLGWRATVHHGLPRALHAFDKRGGDSVVFLGRMSPEKGCEAAIEIALRAGRRLRMAGKIDQEDADYWAARVDPLRARHGIDYVGEIGGRTKDEFLGSAAALLFPIDWPEPFGLVMIEAMACGTPVIAFRRGSVPEVIEDGVTGFVVDDVDGAVAALARIHELDRRRIRETFERRWVVERMTDDYLDVYQELHEATHGQPIAGGSGRRAARPSYRASGARVAR
jgi:glycosyltransferase involved in cell wall biosynthesis